MDTIAIVGAGQAGGWAASTLRSQGFAGRVVLIGDEAHPAHERPPLSKAVLAGTAEPQSTHLFKADAFSALGLESDQHDVNLQMLGLPSRWTEPIVRGAMAAQSFSLFYVEGENIVGVVSVNAPRELRVAKRLMQQGKPACAEDLANPSVNLAKL